MYIFWWCCSLLITTIIRMQLLKQEGRDGYKLHQLLVNNFNAGQRCKHTKNLHTDPQIHNFSRQWWQALVRLKENLGDYLTMILCQCNPAYEYIIIYRTQNLELFALNVVHRNLWKHNYIANQNRGLVRFTITSRYGLYFTVQIISADSMTQ